MKFSHAFIPTLRDFPKEAEIISHKLLLKAGFIQKLSSGIYNYLPLGLKVIQKIEKVIRNHMEIAGAQEVLMPTVLPAELWKETGRWDVYGKELLRFLDRHENEFCLGPTHEEIIVDLVKRHVQSYRQLPVSLYQIQTKFRDEIRPRFGLMRAREFIMKDCYSFDLTKDDALKSYQTYYQAYQNIFNELGLKYRATQALSGAIGGNHSHEFQVLAEAGEDEIITCTSCSFAANKEKWDEAGYQECPECQTTELQTFRGIEVGQVFYLGTKYSHALQAQFLDNQGQKQDIEMGCYGIGVGRTAQAAIEQNHDEKGMIWPVKMAPFAIELITLGDKADLIQKAQTIFTDLKTEGFDICWDDRNVSAGVKLNDADLIGMPIQLILGNRGLKNEKLEVKIRKTGQKADVAFNQINEYLQNQLKQMIK